MKCPYCGGEVSVNDVRCPYCGNLNPEGAAFQGEVRRRRKLNEYLRQKMRDQLWLPLAQRIMNLAIVILALLWILITVLGMIWYLVRDPRTLGLGRPDDYESQLETLYDEGRYGELYAYMDRYSLDGQDYPQYMQMALYYYTYTDFVQYSMNCTQALEKGSIPDDFHLEYAIDSAAELMQPYIPAYPDTYPVNQENLNIYQEEARTFLLGMLKLTEDEIQILYPEEDGSGYVSFTEIEQLMELAKERLKEEGYHESEE